MNHVHDVQASGHRRGRLTLPLVWYWSLTITAMISLTFLLLGPELRHWFILPIWLSGALITVDAIRWFQGRYDSFDPRGLVGLLGFHFFFLSPLLFVYWDMRMLYIDNPVDWRPWIGIMSALNAVGLVAYRFIVQIPAKPKPVIHKAKTWEIRPERFWLVWSILVAIGLVAELYVFLRIGGIAGYVAEQAAKMGVLNGTGAILMFAESVPILLFMALMRKRPKGNSLMRVFFYLFLFLVLEVFFSGLHGSRTALIIPLFWAVGMVHYVWRPISRKSILIGLIPLVAFIVLYGFYKDLGADSFALLTGRASVMELQDRAQARGWQNTLVGDLSRVSTQAMLVYRLSGPASWYELGYGRTYVGDVATVIPSALWPGHPIGKMREGTNLLYGRSAFEIGGLRASQVYGLAGEAMLNFHFIGVPFVFVLWALLVRRTAHWTAKLPEGDLRRLISPFMIYLVVSLLAGDIDNAVVSLVTQALLPFILIWLGSKAVAAGTPEPGMEPTSGGNGNGSDCYP